MYRYPDFPDEIYVELTNACNARCTICATQAMTRPRQVMDFNLFRKIINECGRHGAHRILPFLHGETLLVPGVLDYFRYIRKVSPGSHVNLTTNGSKLSGEVSRAILQEDLLDSLILSMEGADKETYERMRAGLSFEEVRDNFQRFIRLRSELGKRKPTVHVSMVVVDQNRHCKANMAELWKDADEVRFSVFFNWAGKVQGRSLKSGYRLNFCERLYHYVTILVDGRVAMCCFDSDGEYIVGDTRRQTIEEVWRSAEFEQKRRQLFARDFSSLPLCSRCDYIRHPAWTAPFVRIRYGVQRRLPGFAGALDRLYKEWLDK
jgi:radical SAM protein with 4Fe4S-binding SPASM domain